jgi:hypothetical protein
MDFGLPGALIYSFGVGVLSGWGYALLRKQRESPVRLLVMCHVATALVLTAFVNKFNNTASWYIALATLAPFAVEWARDKAGLRVATDVGRDASTDHRML